MKSLNRQQLIYDFVKKHEEVSTNTIADYFKISPVTVRRYLDNLEKNGLIYRKYGKAILSNQKKEELSFSLRCIKNSELKQKIAENTLPYLIQSSSIFVDASSTALAALKLLPKSKPLTVYASNSVVFKYLQDYPNVRLFVLGGYLSKTDGVTLDSEITMNVAKEIFVDSAFVSCSGFSLDGFYDTATTGIDVKRIILNNSACNFLLADHTKYNVKDVFQVASWNSVHKLICDSSFHKKAECQLRSMGVDIIY